MTYTLDQLRDLRDAIDAHLSGKPVECSDGKVWYQPPDPSFDSGWHWRPKAEAVTRPWNCPADVPMPVCWLKVAGCVVLVTAVCIHGINYNEAFHTWDSLVPDLRYSTTCRPDDWHPLTVEEKP